jgi:phosphate butyryltransferase
MKKGSLSAILVGNEKKIREIASKLNLDLTNATIFNEENDVLAVKRAVKFVRDKEADILMKGNVTSATFLRGVSG